MERRRSYIGRLRLKGIIPVSDCGRRASAIPEIPKPPSSPSTRCPTHYVISRLVPHIRFNSSPCWTLKKASLIPAEILRQVHQYFENYKCFITIDTSVGLFIEPNIPGKFIVWFRNETTLLVLWQPPYPAGIYTHYKISIDPSDAIESVLYVEKEGEPPGPAQAAFKGLVPGQFTARIYYKTIKYTK